MAQFSFNSFNRTRKFDFDTTAISGEYKNLETLYKENGHDKVYQVKGLYISTKSEFTEESPIAATATCYVNLPDHQLADVKEMIDSPMAVLAINKGLAGFVIRPYEKKLQRKTGVVTRICYSAEWVDVEPQDFEDEEEEEILE